VDILALASIAIKASLYVGALASAGLVMVRLAFPSPLTVIDREVRNLAAGFGMLGLAAAVLGYLLGGAVLTGDVSGVIDPDMLGLLWQTSAGTALKFELIGLSLPVAGVMTGGAGLPVALAGAALVLWSFTRTGHLSTSEADWVRLVRFLHLAGVAFWVGVLSPLRRLYLDPGTAGQAAELGTGFGVIASVVVPLLLVAGVILAWHLVGTPEALVTTAYGRALVLKVALVASLLSLAALNKFRFVPALVAGKAGAGSGLALSIRLEWLAILAILVTTATFTSILMVPS